ncbi:MAG: ATP-binding protein [Candidatus Thorarchaeota archaeon]
MTKTHDVHVKEWENIFQAIGHPIMILDKDYRVLLVNKATVNTLNRPEEEMNGKFCHEIFHKSDEPACGCPLTALKDSLKLETNEMLIEALGGTYLVSCTPIYADDGTLDRVIHIATDVSARYRAEEELEAVLDIMAHDLRNRLQATLLGAEILGDTCSGAESLDAIEAIIDSVGSLGTIIEKVQSTRGFLNVPLHDVILEDVLMQAVKILRYRHPSVQVNLKIEIQNAIVRADAFLENLFINILENGVVHNPSKTKILWVHATKSGSLYEIAISDNGPGIPKHLIGTLFDSERRFGGIGITQSVRIAKKYGGRIKFKPRFEKEECRGSEFTICIPKS